MIISHKYEFIFIKTSKTAGTSIEIALSKFCGPDDIITPISDEDENIRQHLGYRGPQNYEGFYNHISAAEIKENISENTWNKYFKFCFERNPWDRYISLYYYINKTEPRPELKNFVDSNAVYRLKQNGYDNYTIDDKIVVDKVCMFESLKYELESIAKTLKLPELLELPRAKCHFRKDHRHYSLMIDSDTKEKINHLFSQEIKFFNFTF